MFAALSVSGTARYRPKLRTKGEKGMQKPGLATRRLLITLIMLLMLFVLSGCFSARIHLKINMSGSAEMEVTISATRPMMNLGEAGGMFDHIRDDLEKDGFTIEDFEADSQVGFIAAKKAASIKEFSTLALGEGLVISDEPIVTVSKHLLTNTYQVNTDLDLENVLEDNGAAFTRLADVRFALTLPVRPAEHNADAVSEDGKTLEWKLNTGEDNPINVTATTPSILSILLIALLVLACIAVPIVILLLRRKKTGDEAAPSK